MNSFSFFSILCILQIFSTFAPFVPFILYISMAEAVTQPVCVRFVSVAYICTLYVQNHFVREREGARLLRGFVVGVPTRQYLTVEGRGLLQTSYVHYTMCFRIVRIAVQPALLAHYCYSLSIDQRPRGNIIAPDSREGNHTGGRLLHSTDNWVGGSTM